MIPMGQAGWQISVGEKSLTNKIEADCRGLVTNQTQYNNSSTQSWWRDFSLQSQGILNQGLNSQGGFGLNTDNFQFWNLFTANEQLFEKTSS